METKDRINAVRDLSYRQMPNHLYHNFNHAVDVYNVATELAKAEGIGTKNTELLQTAAWLHDIILISKYTNNEEQSALLAENHLPLFFGYSVGEANEVGKLIRATKYPTEPKGLLQEIICDADVANVGRKDFFEKGYAVFMELGIPREKWNDMQRGFLKGHKFYTDSAKKIYGPGKERNIQLLEGGMK